MDAQDQIVISAFAVLSEADATPTAICEAIVRLGKPLDAAQIERTAPLIAKYLHHKNFLVQYQALWFVGCWGKLPQCLEEVMRAAREDNNVDNHPTQRDALVKS